MKIHPLLKLLAAICFLVLSTAEAGCSDRNPPATNVPADAQSVFASHPSTGAGLSPQGGTITGATAGGGLVGSNGKLGLLTSCGSGQVPVYSGGVWGCGTGGIGNTAGSNVIVKSSGAGSGVIASSIADDGTTVTTFSKLQFGPMTIPAQNQAFFSLQSVFTTTQFWIQEDDVGHVGSGGNNEVINLVLRDNSTFALGSGGTATAGSLDIAVTTGVASGSGDLTAIAIVASATGCAGAGQCEALKAPHGSINVTDGGNSFGATTVNSSLTDTGTFTVSGGGLVKLGANVDGFTVTNAGTSGAIIGIGNFNTGAPFSIKNTTSGPSGMTIHADTSLNANDSGQIVFNRGAGNGSEKGGLVLVGNAGSYASGSLVNDMLLYNYDAASAGQGISFATGSGPTVRMRIDNAGITTFNGQIHVGAASLPAFRRVQIDSTTATDEEMLWIEDDATGHVGTGGQNQAINIVTRVQGSSDLTAADGTATGLDIAITQTRSAGTHNLTSTGLLVNVTGDCSLAGGHCYAFNSSHGEMVQTDAAHFGAMDMTSLNDSGSATMASITNTGTTTLGTSGAGNATTVNGTIDIRSSNSDDWVSIQSSASGGRKFYIESSATAGTQPASLNIYDNTAGAVRWYIRNAGDVVNVNNLTIGAGVQILSGGTPSANHGTLTTSSTDWSGSITTVGSFTSVVVTYSTAFPNRSRCTATANSISVAVETIIVTTTASAATFSCYSVAAAPVLTNCDDFTYQCIGQ